MTSSAGTFRRVDAMALNGWPEGLFITLAGVRPQTIRQARYRQQPTIDQRTARLIAAAFRRWWNVDPATQGVDARRRNRAATLAKQRGAVPALAWDDIDDPAETPKLGARGNTRRLIHAEDVEWLVRAGATWPSITARLGRPRNSIQEAMKDQGRRDLIDALDQATAGVAA